MLRGYGSNGEDVLDILAVRKGEAWTLREPLKRFSIAHLIAAYLFFQATR
ncbi:hypothetical protein [Streptomyces sp. NPDC001037]